MSRRRVIGLVILGLVIFAISSFGVRVLSQAGQFTTIKTVRTGNCTVHGGLKAPEDIVVDRTTHRAFFSSLDRKLVRAGGADTIRGSIFSVDLSKLTEGGQSEPRNVTPDMPKNFHPLGLSLFTGPDGAKRLFVINQGDGENHKVEIFSIAADTFAHVKTIDLKGTVGFANDILAVGDESFYVTDSTGGGIISRFLDFAFQRTRSQVMYYNGQEIIAAADGFVMANGIAMSRNGEDVYVLDTFARSMRFFKRDKTSGMLRDSGVLFIGTGVDNIDVAADGALWMAAHPKLIDYALYASGLGKISSSQVIHAVRGKTSGGEMRTAYLDLGIEISGSSVAVAYGNNFIIGSGLEDKFVICAQK